MVNQDLSFSIRTSQLPDESNRMKMMKTLKMRILIRSRLAHAGTRGARVMKRELRAAQERAACGACGTGALGEAVGEKWGGALWWMCLTHATLGVCVNNPKFHLVPYCNKLPQTVSTVVI